MSILANLNRDRQTDGQRSMLRAEAELIAEYDAMRRAYVAALAGNNVEGALLWSRRANSIVREMACMAEQSTG